MTAQSERIAKQLEREVAKATRFFVFELVRLLKLNAAASATGTPVDTGHARRNWIMSVGSPDTVERGQGGDDGRAAVMAWSLADGPLYVNNNAPYILRLNDGHSKQQPAGFIERSIDEAYALTNTRFRDANIVVGTVASLGGDAAENLASAYSPFDDE